jgi:uncharacterized protein YceK
MAYPGALKVHAYVPAPITISYGFLDLPPSAALDTLLLPIDLIRNTRKKQSHPEPTPEMPQ